MGEPLPGVQGGGSLSQAGASTGETWSPGISKGRPPSAAAEYPWAHGQGFKAKALPAVLGGGRC